MTKVSKSSEILKTSLLRFATNVKFHKIKKKRFKIIKARGLESSETKINISSKVPGSPSAP